MSVTQVKKSIVVGLVWIGLVGLFAAGTTLGLDMKVRQLVNDRPDLKCERTSALKAVEVLLRKRPNFDFYLPAEQRGDLLESVNSELIDCSDLNDDGNNEMILLVAGLMGGGPNSFSWFILEQGDKRWKAVFQRTVPSPRLRVRDGVLTESTPGYRKGDRTDRPSLQRLGRVVPDGDSWRYLSEDGGSQSREISLSPETLTADYVGPLAVSDAQPKDAIAAFGAPTFEGDLGSVCSLYWSDLGLKVDFADLGGRDPCEVGSVQRFAVSDSAARTAGWEGPWGVRVGMTLKQVLEIFPSALLTISDYRPPDIPDWEAWDLERVPSVFGPDGSLATVTGYFDDDRLRWLDFYVGGAGE